MGIILWDQAWRIKYSGTGPRVFVSPGPTKGDFLNQIKGQINYLSSVLPQIKGQIKYLCSSLIFYHIKGRIKDLGSNLIQIKVHVKYWGSDFNQI